MRSSSKPNRIESPYRVSVAHCEAVAKPLLCLLAVPFWISGRDAALFDGCDHVINLKAGYSYLESPYFPNNYPPGTSCRYKFVAPLDHYIEAQCSLNLDKRNGGCRTEYLYLSRDGDVQLRGSEQLCGTGNFVRTSLFRTLTMAYASYGNTGRFRCRLNTRPQPCDCGWTIGSKISYGQEAGINEFPSMVALRDRTISLPTFCDGTIVSHYFVVTAAHCTRFQNVAAKIIVIAGDHDLKRGDETRYTAMYDVAQIFEHSGFTAKPVQNDIALLRTAQPIEWSRGVGPICLPPSTQSSNKFLYKFVDIIGWGTTTFGGVLANKLQKANLMILENSVCAKKYKGLAPVFGTQVCTYDYSGNRRESCQWDSGGPVILRGQRQFLVGIISFGNPCGVTAYSIGVNTRITSYLGWIRQRVGATCHMNL